MKRFNLSWSYYHQKEFKAHFNFFLTFLQYTTPHWLHIQKRKTSKSKSLANDLDSWLQASLLFCLISLEIFLGCCLALNSSFFFLIHSNPEATEKYKRERNINENVINMTSHFMWMISLLGLCFFGSFFYEVFCVGHVRLKRMKFWENYQQIKSNMTTSVNIW
jgi:hypothetical protein